MKNKTLNLLLTLFCTTQLICSDHEKGTITVPTPQGNLNIDYLIEQLALPSKDAPDKDIGGWIIYFDNNAKFIKDKTGAQADGQFGNFFFNTKEEAQEYLTKTIIPQLRRQ